MWFFLSLWAAAGSGTADALSKRALEKSRVPTVAWARPGWAALVLSPCLLFAHAPSDPRVFWQSVLLAMPLEVGAALAMQTAFRISPLSLAVPCLAFTPVFLLGFGWLYLGERPGVVGAIGVALIAIGTFLLHTAGGERTVGAFLRRMRHERGAQLMLIVAFLFALTSVLCKRAILASSALFFPPVYYALIAIGLLPFQWGGPRSWARLVEQPGVFAAMGLAEGSALFFQFHAFVAADVAYVVAVKRLSLLLSVVYGRWWFGERDWRSRLSGAAIMVTGAILIALAPR